MNLVEALSAAGQGGGDDPLWRFPEEGVSLPLSALAARAVDDAVRLGGLGVGPGDRVGLLLENASAYVTLLFGLWRLGAVAVPLRPRPDRSPEFDGYLERVDRRCAFKALLFPDSVGSAASEWDRPKRRVLTLGTFASLPASGGAPAPHPSEPSDLAAVQFSSGSTGEPKGVLVTHAMLAAQVEQLDLTFRAHCRPEGLGSSASWLPFNHDLGLFIGILQPLFRRCANLLAPPRHYLAHPRRWFAWMAEHRVELNFTTNLAMAGSARALARLEPGQLDLSGLFLYFGAEKVSPGVLARTRELLERQSMSERQILVGYGMAENALGAASTARGRIHSVWVDAARAPHLRIADPGAPGGQEVLAVGEPHPRTRITVRDESGAELPELGLGEICVEGPCVTPGYLEDPEATRRALGRGYLRTRDLGFWHHGELYFFSRMDDLLVVGGRNIVPDDVEACAESVATVSPGGSVLIEAGRPGEGAGGMVLLVERPVVRSTPGTGALGRDIQSEVYRRLGVLVPRVLLCAKGTVEKTTSGKKRRTAIRERFLAGRLEIFTSPPAGGA